MFEGPEGAIFAFGAGFAIVFAEADEEGVEFVIYCYFRSYIHFAILFYLFVIAFGVDKAMTGEDAVGVGIDDESGFFEGVEDDGVGGFAADAIN